MSSSELSLAISQVVSRAMAGQPIDAAAEGEQLAARYPGLNLSADLIGKAICRTAAMMGVALPGAEESMEAAATGTGSATRLLPPEIDRLIGDELLSAIAPEPVISIQVGDGSVANDPLEILPVMQGAIPQTRLSSSRPLSAMRRILFGA